MIACSVCAIFRTKYKWFASHFEWYNFRSIVGCPRWESRYSKESAKGKAYILFIPIKFISDYWRINSKTEKILCLLDISILFPEGIS
jgi:hypothetical protein